MEELLPIYTKGHNWQLREDGKIDFMAMNEDYCNGPMCLTCYYSFCQHCTNFEDVEWCDSYKPNRRVSLRKMFIRRKR